MLGEVQIQFYVYIILMAIFAIGSIFFQLKMRSMNEEEYNYRQYDFKYRRA